MNAVVATLAMMELVFIALGFALVQRISTRGVVIPIVMLGKMTRTTFRTRVSQGLVYYTDNNYLTRANAVRSRRRGAVSVGAMAHGLWQTFFQSSQRKV